MLGLNKISHNYFGRIISLLISLVEFSPNETKKNKPGFIKNVGLYKGLYKEWPHPSPAVLAQSVNSHCIPKRHRMV